MNLCLGLRNLSTSRPSDAPVRLPAPNILDNRIRDSHLARYLRRGFLLRPLASIDRQGLLVRNFRSMICFAHGPSWWLSRCVCRDRVRLANPYSANNMGLYTKVLGDRIHTFLISKLVDSDCLLICENSFWTVLSRHNAGAGFVGHVFGSCSQHKMLGIATPRVVAHVPHDMLGLERSARHLECHHMRLATSAVPPSVAVTICVCRAVPNPTAGFRVERCAGVHVADETTESRVAVIRTEPLPAVLACLGIEIERHDSHTVTSGACVGVIPARCISSRLRDAQHGGSMTEPASLALLSMACRDLRMARPIALPQHSCG